MWILSIYFLLISADQLSPAGTEYTCDCGRRNSINSILWRLFDGQEAMKNEFPMMAAVMVRGQPICGATIITERHVLTAAHCTEGFVESAPFILRVGAHYIFDDNEETALNIGVKDVYNYSMIPTRSFLHDIALLVTQTTIPFSRAIGPACLPNRKMDLHLQDSTVIGWGSTVYQDTSEVLMKIDMTIISSRFCEPYINLPTGGNVFCGITSNVDRVCRGDSGGPVLWMDPDTGRETLVGLVSYGMGDCPVPGTPGVYTDVTAYLEWITATVQETVPGLSACYKVTYQLFSGLP